MTSDSTDSVRAVDWRDDTLVLLDQRRLPAMEVRLSYQDSGAVAEAIADMVVRGAPAIGIAAAYGAVLAARAAYAAGPKGWREAFTRDLRVLEQARPTAVNLGWAVARMARAAAGLSGDPVPALLAEARRIHQEDVAANRAMGRLGAALMGEPGPVITHCNTGSLATGGFGTALGVVRAGWAAGTITRVFADETRPWLQGARLTAWELVRDGIPVELIVDGAAAHVMKTAGVQWAIVGADRIAANGDVANKIGTYGLAVSARHHGVRFMVVAPTSTVDMAVPSGDAIPIEERDPREVLTASGQPVAPAGAGARNPAFDITPAGLVDAIVTERGVVRRPDGAGMARLMGGRGA